MLGADLWKRLRQRLNVCRSTDPRDREEVLDFNECQGTNLRTDESNPLKKRA